MRKGDFLRWFDKLGFSERVVRTREPGGLTMEISIRVATMEDIPTLRQLIPASARGLSRGYYTSEQIESAIQYVFGVDTQLIADRTYYVAESAGQILGCGGWSRRKTL